MSRNSTKKKFGIALFSFPVAIVGLLMYYHFDPVQHAIFPACPFFYATEFYCPGCGGQRAFHALLHGDIWGAIQHNFLLLLLIFVGIYKAYLILTKTSESSSNILYKNKTPWILLILVIGFWVLRNLPFEPFLYLAP